MPLWVVLISLIIFRYGTLAVALTSLQIVVSSLPRVPKFCGFIANLSSVTILLNLRSSAFSTASLNRWVHCPELWGRPWEGLLGPGH